MMRDSPSLCVVVPSYNEEEVIGNSVAELLNVIDRLICEKKIDSDNSGILVVDDGSSDATWDIINELYRQDSRVKGIKLARNYGHQNALLAGLMSSNSDLVVSIDADLQDDVRVIEKMIDRHNIDGDEIVYGVRMDRGTDSAFKRATATLFYKMMRMFGVELIEHHADFRLMTRKAVNALAEFNEVNLFLRGVVPLIGMKSSKLYYDRMERVAGKSKYPLKKMLALALVGITSFSVVPLRFISVLGFVVFLVSCVLGVWSLFAVFVGNASVPGWASTVLPIYFIGGVQLLSIGVLGEYIGKIYSEVKSRPKYIIESIIE